VTIGYPAKLPFEVTQVSSHLWATLSAELPKWKYSHAAGLTSIPFTCEQINSELNCVLRCFIYGLFNDIVNLFYTVKEG
jgi:hypothetical protein